MKKLIGIVGVVALGLAALSTAVEAQQPTDDSIDIEYNEGTCRVSIDWEDGTEDTTVLKVSVDAIQRPNVNVNDVVGKQDQVLSSFTLDENEDEQRVIAEIYDGEKLLDREVQDLLCDPPAPTPVPATPTPVPATATPAPTATPVVVERIVTQIVPILVTPVVPPPLPTTAPVVVAQPSGVIRPPSTGDGGLLDTVLPTAWFHDDPAGDSYWRNSHYSFSWLSQVQFYWLF